MGQDKASIVLDGRTLLERSVSLLHSLNLPVAVCARREQVLPGSGFERVDDPEPGIGPVGGLLAAMTTCPGENLLVIAVDLPHLEASTLGRLLDQHDPEFAVTAYRSPGDARVEPLCAVYESTVESFLRSAAAAGELSLRRILESSGRLQLIEAAHPLELIDLDTPDALANLVSRNEPTVPMPSIQLRIRYFALLREQRGLSEETLSSEHSDPAKLYDALRQKHGLSLTSESLQIAINDEFMPWSTPLKNGDTIVFLPPMAGG